jgi:PAS domain S-box-containing protein
VEAATRALRDSNRKLEEAQRLARIGDFRWDQNDDSVAWSAHMRSMLGYRDDDAISLDLIRRKVHHPDDAERVMSWITSGIEGGAERLGPEVYRLVRKSGETIWVEANLRIDRSAGRKPVVFGTCQDITARVEMERALLEAKAAAEQAANAKSTFLASVSHELRTPLNAIIGFTDLLQETAAPTLSAKQREQLSNVQAAARQLYELVDNVLELTNAEQIDFRVQPTTFSLGECVERALAQVDFLAAQRGIRIHNRMAEGADVDCYADEFRTRQVLVNLLTNAVKYNRQGGSVTIAPAEATKGHVRLNVTDTGEGIPEDLLGVIFNIFSRLNVDPMVAGDGTGVGLTIAKRLVERMDGRIGVESAVGAGSTFWIELPAAPGPDS